jgi:hypothetical protein
VRGRETQRVELWFPPRCYALRRASPRIPDKTGSPLSPSRSRSGFASAEQGRRASRGRRSGRVASIDREVPADKAIVRAGSAGNAGQLAASPPGNSAAGNSTAVAADQHRPIAAAGGRYRGCNGLASAERHVAAVRRRLHPHSPCAGFGVASHRDILGNGARRSAMPHETGVIEAIAARHVIGVLLREPVERRTIRIRRSSPGDRGTQDSNYPKRSHRAPLPLIPPDHLCGRKAAA